MWWTNLTPTSLCLKDLLKALKRFLSVRWCWPRFLHYKRRWQSLSEHSADHKAVSNFYISFEFRHPYVDTDLQWTVAKRQDSRKWTNFVLHFCDFFRQLFYYLLLFPGAKIKKKCSWTSISYHSSWWRSFLMQEQESVPPGG